MGEPHLRELSKGGSACSRVPSVLRCRVVCFPSPLLSGTIGLGKVLSPPGGQSKLSWSAQII